MAAIDPVAVIGCVVQLFVLQWAPYKPPAINIPVFHISTGQYFDRAIRSGLTTKDKGDETDGGQSP